MLSQYDTALGNQGPSTVSHTLLFGENVLSSSKELHDRLLSGVDYKIVQALELPHDVPCYQNEGGYVSPLRDEIHRT